MNEAVKEKTLTGLPKFKPYPAYKDSGVEWLGEIPSHWAVKPLKRVVSINPETLAEDTDPDYEFEYVEINDVNSNGRIIRNKFMHFNDAPSRARRKVTKGDTVVSTVRTYLKAIALIKESSSPELIVSTGFAVLRTKGEIEDAFLWRLVQSSVFVEKVVSHSEGVGYPAITPYILGALPIWFPPAPEQKEIITFLNQETIKIDALIAKQERLMELLQEKRTALITYAVTKGLDPDVPMKNSGVEWLGEIPYRWKVRKFKWLVEVQEGPGIMASDFRDEGVPLLRIRNLTPGVTDIEGCNYLDPEKVTRQWKQFRLEEGDLLISGSASTGQVSFVSKEARGAIAYTGIFSIRPILNNLEKKYLAYYVSSDYFLQQVNSLSTGVGIRHYGPTHLRVVIFPLPPIDEQRAICSKLDSLLERIDQLISRAVFLTELLTEYRTALISAAVTGKIDVRGEVS